MMYFFLGAFIYLVWTFAGITFFIFTMGFKFRKEKWYDWVLLIPVMPIALIIGWMNKK